MLQQTLISVESNEKSILLGQTQTKNSEKYNDVEYGESTLLRSEMFTRENSNDNIEKSCMELFQNEFQLPFFSLLEGNGKVIDVQSTFTPKPICWTIMIRTLFTGFTIICTIQDMKSSQWIQMWFGYLTNLSVLFTLMYQIPVLLCSLQPNCFLIQPKQGEDAINEQGLSFVICYLWIMYSIAMTFELSVSIIYWTLIYHTEPYHVNIYRVSKFHGIIATLLYMDGFMICKIPIRLKHFIAPWLISLMYLIWNITQSLSGIGTEKGKHNGLPLYPVFNWKNDFHKTAIMVSLLLFVLLPSFYLFLWVSSMISCSCRCNGSSRRYLQ